MKMSLALFPDHIVKKYNLGEKSKNGFVYVELRKAIYGLPQAGSLTNKLLKKRLEPHGYLEVPHTPDGFSSQVKHVCTTRTHMVWHSTLILRTA